MAAMAVLTRVLRRTDRENSAPSSTQAPISFLVPNAESPRKMIWTCGLQARAVVMACLTWETAARPEPACPERSRASAITGAAVAVEMVVISGDSPRRPSAAPGDLGVPEQGVLLVVAVDRAQQRVDVQKRASLGPGQQRHPPRQRHQMRAKRRRTAMTRGGTHEQHVAAGHAGGVAKGEMTAASLQRDQPHGRLVFCAINSLHKCNGR